MPSSSAIGYFVLERNRTETTPAPALGGSFLSDIRRLGTILEVLLRPDEIV